ncbi:gluconokinase [Simplicispira suum]|nr:gluconokinase [Simplicispira suum]
MPASHFSGSFVVMGVAGCGKSSLGEACAQRLGLRLLEGDAFHSPANLEKMQSGVPLSDADRAAWLALLARKLAQPGASLVLTCSALRRSYRDTLRAGSPGLRFVFLQLSESEARKRVAARRGHVFPASLVASQFETLENPLGEPGVLVLDATRPLSDLCDAVCAWLVASVEA